MKLNKYGDAADRSGVAVGEGGVSVFQMAGERPNMHVIISCRPAYHIPGLAVDKMFWFAIVTFELNVQLATSVLNNDDTRRQLRSSSA